MNDQTPTAPNMTCAAGDPRLEILKAADVPAVLRLHREVHASLPDRRVLYLHDGEFFKSILIGDGGVVGARLRGRLVGYAAFRRASRAPESYYHGLALPGIDPERAAETAGSVVHTDFRGCGLHVALCRTRQELARRSGYQHMAAAVSVANPAGAATCFHCDLEVRALHFDEDGTNLLFYTCLQRRTPIMAPAIERWVDLADIDSHRAAVNRGYRGVKGRRVDGALLIGYTARRMDARGMPALEQSPSPAVARRASDSRTPVN